MMSNLTPENIHLLIREEFGETAVSDLDKSATMPNFTVLIHELWQPIAYFLRTDERLKLNYLACLSGVDYNDGNLGVIYNLESISELHHKIAVKLKCSKDQNRVPSVAEIWRTAEWHEREAYDLIGIIFEGNPDLRRILCPEDWQGHPLRKDYKVQEEYHGIKVPY